MKRTLLVILVLVLGISAWGQNSSFLSLASRGVFTNAQDKAFDELDFSKLDKNYLFGGWSNFVGLTNIGQNNNSFQFGTHLTAPVPLSLYTSLYHKYEDIPAGVKDKSGTFKTYAKKTIVSGTTTTDHQYVSQSEDKKFDFERTYTIDDRVYGLFALGPIGLGANIRYFVSNNGDPVNNYTRTLTEYYDTLKADAAAAPVTAVNYTETASKSAKNLTTSISMYVPVILDKHVFSARYANDFNDKSTTESTTVSAHKDTTDGVATITDTEKKDAINKVTSNTFTLGYMTRLPALLGTHSDNRIDLNASLNFTLHTGEFSGAEATQTWTANKVTKQNRAEETKAFEYTAFTPITVNVGSAHAFYFDPAEGLRFGFIPGVTAMYSTAYNASSSNPDITVSNGNIVLTKETKVTSTDVNNNGVFTDAVDTIVTKTTVYDAQTVTETGTFSLTFGLPAAVRVKLGSLPFSFVLGSRLTGIMSLAVATKKTEASTVTTETKTGTGATSTIVVEKNGGANTTSTTSFTFSPSALNSFGLNAELPAGISMDVRLNTKNLLELEALSVQFIIPLN